MIGTKNHEPSTHVDQPERGRGRGPRRPRTRAEHAVPGTGTRGRTAPRPSARDHHDDPQQDQGSTRRSVGTWSGTRVDPSVNASTIRTTTGPIPNTAIRRVTTAAHQPVSRLAERPAGRPQRRDRRPVQPPDPQKHAPPRAPARRRPRPGPRSGVPPRNCDPSKVIAVVATIAIRKTGMASSGRHVATAPGGGGKATPSPGMEPPGRGGGGGTGPPGRGGGGGTGPPGRGGGGGTGPPGGGGSSGLTRGPPRARAREPAGTPSVRRHAGRAARGPGRRTRRWSRRPPLGRARCRCR